MAPVYILLLQVMHRPALIALSIANVNYSLPDLWVSTLAEGGFYPLTSVVKLRELEAHQVS